MKNLKKLVATITLTGIIIIGVTNAKAGMNMSDLVKRTDVEPCVEKVEDKVDSGILVGLRGILVGFTGILVGFKDAPTECGILVGKS